MVTPVNGSKLTSSSGTFTWTTGTGASAYALWVGSSPNAYDLYGQQVSGTSQVVPLPVDGRPLYVNLLSSINNQWQKSTSYVYTALDNKARMLTPASSGTFTSSSGTFTWSLGTGGGPYALWVGSTPGTYDLYGQFVSGTSQVVPLPTDGRRIYVRLYSSMSGQLKFNGYTYSAFSGTDRRLK